MMPPSDRRRARRLNSEELPDELFGRIRPGHQIRIVNASSFGVLIESSRRLLPGTNVELHLELREIRHQTRTRVVRCQVGCVMAHALIFRGALNVERPIPWFSEGPDAVGTGSAWHVNKFGQ